METNLEWEPYPLELLEMNGRTYDKEIENLGELWLMENEYLKNRDFLDELAEEAWYRFATIYSKNPKTKNLFIDCVISVIPAISDRTITKREILRSMVFEIASRLSRMFWENRKRKHKLRELRKQRKTPRSILKERKEKAQKDAVDTLEHGTYHGELLIPGIRPKAPYRAPTNRRTWKRFPKREPIPFEEQLGSLVAQVDHDIFLKNVGKI